MAQPARKRPTLDVSPCEGGVGAVCSELLHTLAALAAQVAPAEAERIEALLGSALAGDVDAVRRGLSHNVPAVHAKLEQHERAARRTSEQLKRELRTMQRELEDARERTARDPLTAIYNRGAFDAMFAQQVELAHATGQSLALLMIDIDHFKQVNDRYGHSAGDHVLRAFAEVLSLSFCRARDVVARYGGEEFAVVLVDAAPDQLAQLTRRLLSRVRGTRVETRAGSVQVTCSLGFAQIRPDDSAESLLERADAALYAAKAGGRDRAVDGDARERSRSERVGALLAARAAR
ncbi:MAG: GGDEF domain-containing protein [Myxococcales bacterium]|nr:GGDEF domain-containing protein [Myxococcales bacterium]